MFDIVRHLLLSMILGYADGLVYRVRHAIGIEDDAPVHMTRTAARGLDKRCCRTQEAFLVRIQYRNKRNLRKIQSLAEQVDAHKHIEFAFPQPAENRNAFKRVDIAVEIFDPDASLMKICGKVFCRTLGEGSHKNAVAPFRNLPYLLHEIVYLVL